MPTYISELEFKLMQERVKNKLKPESADPQEAGEPESILAGKIMQYCKNEGYPCQCFRPSRKAIGFLVPGWPD